MKRITPYPVLLLALGAVGAQAAEFQPISQRCEESLALSALPQALRDRANVYVWRGDGFEKTITSDGGFHCIVQRNHPDAIIPECVTESGRDSILQAIMVQTRLTANGLSASEVAEKTEQMIERGEIGSPQEPGVNYMMSAYNLIYSEQQDRIIHFDPHTMFFAPNAKSDSIGGSLEMARATKGFPFVVEAGTHSYIVTITDKSAETDDVLQHCAGQIDVAVSANRAAN